MTCNHCGRQNAPLKKCCEKCGAILEGFTINNVTGKMGYRYADGTFAPGKVFIENGVFTMRLEGTGPIDLYLEKAGIGITGEATEVYRLCYVDLPWVYFTTQDLDKQWGDDWDDAPYEHNAEEPYSPGKYYFADGRVENKPEDWNEDGTPK